MATVVTCERTWIRGEEEDDAPASHEGGGVELDAGTVLPLVTVTTLPLPLPILQRGKASSISMGPTAHQHMAEHQPLLMR